MDCLDHPSSHPSKLVEAWLVKAHSDCLLWRASLCGANPLFDGVRSAQRFGLTFGAEPSLVHWVAPQGAIEPAAPLLGRGAGGRAPGFLLSETLAPAEYPCYDLTSHRPGQRGPVRRRSVG
jgi:hypothetical protein